MDVDEAAATTSATAVVRTSSTPSKAEHSGAESVAILQDTLAWGHVCPTSPGESLTWVFVCIECALFCALKFPSCSVKVVIEKSVHVAQVYVVTCF